MNAFSNHADLAFDVDAMVSRSGPAARRSRGFAAVARWVLDLPRRRAVINELQSLSDHELADIGLSRDEVSRVFDRNFAASRLAA